MAHATIRGHAAQAGIALALLDQRWTHAPAEWFGRFGPTTVNFTYVHWLGDRKGIEQYTKVWDKIILDRQWELTASTKILDKVHQRDVPIYAYANNHYVGHGPATVEMFRQLWSEPTNSE